MPRIAATRAGQAALGAAGTGGAIGVGAALQGEDIAGDAYRELISLPDETWRNHPDFDALAAQIGPDRAKVEIANREAAKAGGKAALATLLTTLIPGGASLEKALAGKGGVGLRDIARAAIGEARQEGLEEGFGQLYGNLAVASVDPSRDVWQGVGEAAGQGAVGGGLLGGGVTAANAALARAARGTQAQPAGVIEEQPQYRLSDLMVHPEIERDEEDVARTDTATPVQDEGRPAESHAMPQPAEAPVEPERSEESRAVAQAAATDAEQALYTPRPITALDRVAEIDARLKEATPEEAAGLVAERERITASWPSAVVGAQTSFATETGARLTGQYALMEADDLVTSHDENLRPVPVYPAELQPRNRERHASEIQIGQIVQKLDPARLGESPDVATGAPIVGADGLVESGNARTIALKRIYQANGQKAEDYRRFLRENAARFGLQPEAVDAMRKPVLVRVRTTPVDRAEFARQANAATVARMSPTEQARADAALLDNLDGLQPDENGDFMSEASRPFVRRFLARLPATEQAALIDPDGNLSQAGYARIRNAVLAKAYGDSPVLLRMVESLDDNTRNLTRALMRVAPRVAKARQDIDSGLLFNIDITPDLVAAVEELSALKDQGVAVRDALAQAGLFGEKLSPEARELLSFLADNIRSPRRIAALIQGYFDALAAAGSPAQPDLFGSRTPPTKAELLVAARRTIDAEEAATRPEEPGGDQESGAQDRWQPAGEESARAGAQEPAPETAGQPARKPVTELAAEPVAEQAVAQPPAPEEREPAPRAPAQPTPAVEQNQEPTPQEATRPDQSLEKESGATGWRETLAGIAARHPQGRMLPKDTPGLKEAVEGLLSEVYQRDGRLELKEAISRANDLLKADARLKEVWNKIPKGLYREAAPKAGEAVSGSPSEDTQPAAGKAKPVAMIDGRPYDYARDNFKPPAVESFMPQSAIDAAMAAIERGDKASTAPVAGPGKEDLARARAVLEPLFQQAARDKPAFDQAVIDIAKASGALGQIIPPGLKDIDRAAEKMAESGDFSRDSVKDLLRATIVVRSYEDAQGVIDEIERVFTLARDPKNRTGAVPIRTNGKTIAPEDPAKYGGYADVMVNVRMPSGLIAEIQINVPEMLAAKEAYGHDIYGILRKNPPQAVKQDLLAASRAFYSEVLASLRNFSSDISLQRDGQRFTGEGISPLYGSRSLMKKTRPSGNLTYERSMPSSSAKSMPKTQPGGNLSGTSIAEPLTQIVAEKYMTDEPVVSYTAGEQEKSHGHPSDDSERGAQVQGAVPLQEPEKARKARGIRRGAGRGDRRGGRAPVDGDVQAGEVGQPRPGGVRPEAGDGGRAEPGARARRDAGIPAGPDIPPKSGRNYRFGPDDLTYEGSWLKKAEQNVAAVELLKTLEKEGRQATPDEQKILAKFIGWGSSEIANAIFGDNKLAKKADAIAAYHAAREAIDAGSVVRSMWRALERMGFKGGMVLEPGAGIGVFAGLMPEAMAHNSVYTGIEFDSITGGILKQLFPDERILVESFVDTKLPRNFYDVAIGNPPFSSTKVLSDPEYAKQALSLHDYFFAKSIDRVKPGGLVVFVTSHYTMDKLNDKARAYLAERADLVGAIRLPQTAFKKNAGTEVVTDVIFLRKKAPGERFEAAQPWAKSVPIEINGNRYHINEYFVANPHMVLGRHADTGSMYAEREYTVEPIAGDIEELFAKAVEQLPENIFRAERGSAAEAAQVREIDFNPKAKKEGNYYVTDAGVLMQREFGVGKRVDLKNPKDIELLKDFVRLRDALKQAHYDQLNDGDWQTSLKKLQSVYAEFTAKHGQIRQYKTKVVKTKAVDEETGKSYTDETIVRVHPIINKIDDDPDYTLVEALEIIDEDTGEIRPSRFLTERVLQKPAAPQINSPADALLSVLNDVGRVDLDLIAKRAGITKREAIEALGTAIYEDPEAGWVAADEYLSGNVKRKLEVAREAALADRRFERNVAALEAAQPAPKTPDEINIALGMNWIPGDVYKQFLLDLAGVTAKVEFNDKTRQWIVEEISGGKSMAATDEWGTAQRNITALLEHALTGRPIRITTTVGHGAERKTVFDPVATEAANQKLAALRERFQAWVWEDAKRADRLVKLYNDQFNTTVPRRFDGRHLTLPGTSKAIEVFDHVKRGAWRIIQSGNTYLAHAVGSGKTFQMVISAMEQKRLGLIKKPMFVVPNHMLKQFAHEFQMLYPAARLMVADEANFHTERRRRFVSRVALSDLDGVIITHSAFKLLDLDPAFKRKMIEEQLEYMRAALDEATQEGNKSLRVKQIEKQIEQLEQRLEAAMSSKGKDTNVRFDELGVDFLYVDEAHEFRKLDFTTARQVKGISPQGSARAFDLYMKVRYLEEKRPGRSLVMASGTPVTNTLAELYTVIRFMNPQALEERGLQDFDSWAAMFGRERTTLEPNAAGQYEPVTRFNKFVNLPELTQMFREFADVLTPDNLAAILGDRRPRVSGGGRKLIVTPKPEAYKAYQQVLTKRVERSREWKPSREEPYNPDPIIRIIGDGRLAAIDMRFVDPKLPNDPDSKLNRMIDDVIRVFKETADMEYRDRNGNVEPVKGATMMVFSDIGFGEGAAQNRGFNARAWFEKRLRDAGIPMSQVAFMSDYKQSAAKLKLFKDMNAGRVRILVGSSKNMGTGVNAQQRLKAMFHLDSPWYPADLEQREGRIIRTGNKNPVVDIYAYATKGTYDENMWKMLAQKQYFIDQAMAGDETVREVEDLDSMSQFDLAAAMIAEDPRVLQLAGARAEVEKLQRLYKAHETQRLRYRSQYDQARSIWEYNTKRLPEVEKIAEKIQDLSGDKFKAKANGKEYTERTKWADALLKTYAELTAKGEIKPKIVGDISGFPIVFGGETIAGKYLTRLKLGVPDPVVLVSPELGDVSPIGMAMRAQNAVADVARLPDRVREYIAQAEAQMAALQTRIDAPFPMAEMLAAKIKEVSDLENELAMAPSGEQSAAATRLSRGIAQDEEFAQTERAYGGRGAYEKAREAGRTKLSYRQWVQVRTPAFKRWFGDWEALRAQQRLDAMEPVNVRVPNEWRDLPADELRQRVRQALEDLRASGEPLHHPEIGDVALSQSGVKKSLSSSADPAKLLLLGDLRKAFEASIFASAKPALDKGPNVVGFEKLLVRLDVAGTPLVATFTVQRQSDGRLFYNAVTLDEQEKETPAASPGDTPIAGERATPAIARVESFSRKSLSRVNPDTVSKIVDADTGEPLLVYHGTAHEFYVFKHGVSKLTDDQNTPGWHFTTDRRNGGFSLSEQEKEGIASRTSARVIEAFLDIKKPLIIKNAREFIDGVTYQWTDRLHQIIERGGHDGIVFPVGDSGFPEYVAIRPEQIKSATGNVGTFVPWNPDIRYARAVSMGRGMALRDLQAVVDRVSKRLANLPRIHVMESPDSLSTRDPNQKALRDYIRQVGAWEDVEGATHNGEIYLFASGIADEARAEHVLATHEITHYGLRGAIGKDLDAALQHIWLNNAKVRQAAERLKKARGGEIKSNVEAVEEVLADMPSHELVQLRGWRRVVRAIRDWLARIGAQRLAERLDGWLKAGLSEQEQADLFVADLVTAARDWVRTGKSRPVALGTRLSTERRLADDLAEQQAWLLKEAKARGYKDVEDLVARNFPLFEKLAALWRQRHPVEGALLSRASASTRGQASADERAERIIGEKAGTAKPLDDLLRKATQAVGLDRLTQAVYEKSGEVLARITPERIKAGVIADYGIPQDVLDARAMMRGRQRQLLRRTGDLLERLMSLSREESRVAYEWMNNADPNAASALERRLPPESIKTLGEVKALIDELSREAVRLGQLSPEAYQRNRFAYLRRSYAKYLSELTKRDAAKRARAIAILGEQYRGRGITEAVSMDRLKNVAPEWWGRKLAKGQADASLKGQTFIRLERRSPVGEGTFALPGTEGKQQSGRVLEVIYWPAEAPIPPRYREWHREGTWEVRGVKGDKLVLWRDFTKEERRRMGEIDEVRFAVARTLQGMIHDVEVGRYLEWLAIHHAKKEGETIPGRVVEASERMRDTFKPGEWVRVPDTVVSGTSVKKYGLLAGRYLPGPIWNDVRQVINYRYQPLGPAYAAVLRAWKTAKTALSPAVHMNNIMANVVMADWHDVTAGHILKALRLLASNDKAAKIVLERFADSGGSIGTFITQELAREQLRPLLDALERELSQASEMQGQIGAAAAVQLALSGRLGEAFEAARRSKPGVLVEKSARAMIDLYETEDQVFRLAAWLKAKEEGASDAEAGKAARKSFLDYHINAPWIQIMRATAFPFIAFTYRSVPMLLEVAAKKPWKIMKLGLIAGTLNALGYALSGGDEDDERELLPDEKSGSVWGLVPKLIRMPWNDVHGSPVFLDVRRWVPVGDVFDIGQGHAAIPLLPSLTPAGPLAILAEIVLNRSQFTGRPITLETDTADEKAKKVADHLYKAFAPNLVFLPFTYAWQSVWDAGSGKTDAFGSERSLPHALLSSVGIKVASYPRDVLRDNAAHKARAEIMEIDRNIQALRREYMMHGIDYDEFSEKVDRQQEKKRKVAEELRSRLQ